MKFPCDHCGLLCNTVKGRSIHKRHCQTVRASPRQERINTDEDHDMIYDFIGENGIIEPVVRDYQFPSEDDDDDSEDGSGYNSNGDSDHEGAGRGLFQEDNAVQREMKYCRLQEDIYRRSFSMSALLESHDVPSFIQCLPPHNDSDAVMISLLNFKRKSGLSNKVGNDLLDLIHSIQPMDGVKVPRDWRSVIRYQEKKSKTFEEYTLRRVVPWPQDWNMDDFNERGHDRPPEVELISRDPLELIACKLVCPTIQYIYREHVQYEYMAENLAGTDIPCTSNLMSSSYARVTEASIREHDAEGILIPIITYSDGVALGLRNKVKANAALMSLGNFSDALHRVDVSKMSIGFLQEIDNVSREILLQHIVRRGNNYSKSTALASLREFGRLLEREYWDMCFQPIKAYEVTGVSMYILGRGMCNVFPRLAYCVGDDPALHRYCGIYEGNALSSCIYCKYSARRDGIYDPRTQSIRDAISIQHDRELAEDGMRKKRLRIPLLNYEIDAIARLKGEGLHHLRSQCMDVPMGFTREGVANHVFRSPCDILHTFMCGICKNCFLWTTCIISQISKIRGSVFVFSQGLLDARVASFKDLPKMANITTTYFRKGISYLTRNKSGSDNAKSTGGAAGLRSCEFVSLLLQLYFAIGTQGDILPNTPQFVIHSNIRVRNVTNVVLTCISKVLDCYFSVRASPITSALLQVLEQKLSNMSNHFIELCQLKDKSCGIVEPTLPLSRKLHAACCNIIPFMRDFGSFDKADTASYESVHRFMTVSLWHLTSKRYASMNVEMAKQAMMLNYSVLNEFRHAAATDSMDQYIKKRGPYVAPEHVEVSALNNMATYRVYVDNNNMLTGADEASFNVFLAHTGSTRNTLSVLLRNKLGGRVWDNLKYPDELNALTLDIISGITIEGNEESRSGKVTLYATPRFQNKRPRHDFVLVQIQDGHQPAQLLTLFKLCNSTGTRMKFYAHIRYMQEETRLHHRPSVSLQCPFQIFQWETHRVGRAAAVPLADVISISTVVSPAFMCHVFSSTLHTPRIKTSSPKLSDRFWYMPHKFTDRAGWEDVDIIPPGAFIEDEQDIEIHIPANNDMAQQQGIDVDNESENDSHSDNDYDDVEDA